MSAYSSSSSSSSSPPPEVVGGGVEVDGGVSDFATASDGGLSSPSHKSKSSSDPCPSPATSSIIHPSPLSFIIAAEGLKSLPLHLVLEGTPRVTRNCFPFGRYDLSLPSFVLPAHSHVGQLATSSSPAETNCWGVRTPRVSKAEVERAGVRDSRMSFARDWRPCKKEDMGLGIEEGCEKEDERDYEERKFTCGVLVAISSC
mmetsp:Transcript_11360/g.23225  ORF Transcript_11360/g.23225 Transcript_11360/m.23225 type:complete len:201 (-) Transcript_11360:52-654(-)